MSVRAARPDNEVGDAYGTSRVIGRGLFILFVNIKYFLGFWNLYTWSLAVPSDQPLCTAAEKGRWVVIAIN